MKFDPAVHHRHSIRLKGYDYTQSGGYYVTLVTFKRECLFGEIIEGEVQLSALGKITDECWRSIPEHFPNVELGAYVVMPNHIHGIIIIHENDEETRVGATQWVAPTPNTFTRPKGPKHGSLGAILGACKMTVTRRAGKELHSGNLWQRNYYEHILRDQSDWECITAYISDNPLHWAKDEENPANSTPCCASGANDRIELNM